MTTDVTIATIRILDDIFVRIAEGAGRDVPVDEAVEAMWTKLESGALRFVINDGRLRIETVSGSEAKRLLLAERLWPLVAARRRVLCGVYEAQPQDVRRPLTAPPD